MKNKEQEIIIGFVSTYEMYKIEESGVKPNTLRVLKFKQEQRLKKATHIRIRKGYTKECFTRRITNITKWDNNWIISWNPNKALSLLKKEYKETLRQKVSSISARHEKEILITKNDCNASWSRQVKEDSIEWNKKIDALEKEVEELKEKIKEISKANAVFIGRRNDILPNKSP